MSSTNKTPNYNLPQWVGTDHPTFSGDFNSAFSAIDTGMNNNKTTAESAQATAQAAQSTAESAQAASANATRVAPMTCDAFDNMYIMAGNQPPEK